MLMQLPVFEGVSLLAEFYAAMPLFRESVESPIT